VVLFSTRSPDKTTVNEDSAGLLAIDDEHGILIVADGAGGQRNGAQASQIAIKCLAEVLHKNAVDDSGLRNAILSGIESANQQILALGTGAASTLVVVELNGRRVRSYHVGDSMALVVGQRGKLHMQTVAHSPVGYGVEAGLLDENEAMLHEHRHIVSNMLGMNEMRIEMGPEVELAEHDTLIIASDGLFDNLPVEEIVQQIRCGDLVETAVQLVADTHHCMQQSDESRPGKPDDLTFIMMRRHS
jgi:serine/threonine protein phosphatase PrpC